MTPSALIEEADLHALVDGELDPERRRKVEDHLLQHPEDAALVEGWRRQNAALRAAFEPVALETPPLSLREAAARPPAPPAGQGPIETGAIHWGRPGAAPRP
ncbi:MAG: anti-sigma factor, partial [Methylocystis sp.]